MSYAAAWSTLRKCQQDGWLEAHFQHWVRQLWAQKEYDRVVSLHRNSVRLLSEKLCGQNGHACNLTRICLELHVRHPAARGVYAQRVFHNVVSVGIQPDRQVWREWMRVKLLATEFLNAVRALWRYKMCSGEEEDLTEEACMYLRARLDKIKADKKVLLEDILFDISRAVSIGLKEADCERLYMLRKAGAAPVAARARVISVHKQLARSVCESQPGPPNRLKVAAAVHMHLLHCVRVQDLPPDLAAGVWRLEETIASAFWKAGRDEQIRMLCKQRYNQAWPPQWARLPVVQSQKLARAWLARGLAQRQLSFDLGHSRADYADVGAQLVDVIDLVKKKERADENAAVMKFFRDTANQVHFKEGESLKLGTGERKANKAEAEEANKAEAEEANKADSEEANKADSEEANKADSEEAKVEEACGSAGALPIRHVAIRKQQTSGSDASAEQQEREGMAAVIIVLVVRWAGATRVAVLQPRHLRALPGRQPAVRDILPLLPDLDGVGRGAAGRGAAAAAGDDKPPPYSVAPPRAPAAAPHNTGASVDAGVDGNTSLDVTHHLSAEDTITSLSLLYGVPAGVLRRHNRLATDGLVAGRKTVGIPRSHYSGQALSRVPDAEEEERKNRLRRWMVATKCAEYEVGVIYLRANGYSLDRAVDAYRGDERWERENPMRGGKGGGRT
ncbi:hypothetical protein DV737_g4986, partial [Chaetothyriales sp. CBS 132003]